MAFAQTNRRCLEKFLTHVQSMSLKVPTITLLEGNETNEAAQFKLENLSTMLSQLEGLLLDLLVKREEDRKFFIDEEEEEEFGNFYPEIDPLSIEPADPSYGPANATNQFSQNLSIKLTRISNADIQNLCNNNQEVYSESNSSHCFDDIETKQEPFQIEGDHEDSCESEVKPVSKKKKVKKKILKTAKKSKKTKTNLLLTQEQIALNEKIRNFLETEVDTLHREDPPYVCFVCQKSFDFVSHITKHLERHIKGMYESCSICGHGVRSVYMKRHIRAKHPSQFESKKKIYAAADYGFTEDELVSGDSGKPFKCPVCGKPYKTKAEALKHISTHNPEGEIGELCFSCGVVCKDIIKHRRTQHGEDEAGNGEHKCPYSPCSRMFRTLTLLKVHLRSSHVFADGETCWEEFVKERERILSTRVRNRRKALLPKQFLICEVCSRRFSNKKNFELHKSQHDPNLRKQCLFPGCGKTLANNEMLKRHQAVHSSERPERCEVCTATFKRRKALYLHMKKMHGLSSDQGRTFQCSYEGCSCPLFRTQGALTKHLNDVHWGSSAS